MQKVRITTPENIEVEYPLADLGTRTAAFVLDFLIQVIVFTFFSLAVISLTDFLAMDEGWIIGISILIIALIVYGYFVVLEMVLNGKTPGKKVFNLRVIRKNGRPITLKHSLIRNLFRIFIDLAGIGAILIFITGNRQRLGDILSSTIVIYEKEQKQPVPLEEIDEDISEYLTEEEYQLLQEFVKRKDTFHNELHLARELKSYFEQKFLPEEIPEGIRKILS